MDDLDAFVIRTNRRLDTLEAALAKLSSGEDSTTAATALMSEGRGSDLDNFNSRLTALEKHTFSAIPAATKPVGGIQTAQLVKEHPPTPQNISLDGRDPVAKAEPHPDTEQADLAGMKAHHGALAASSNGLAELAPQSGDPTAEATKTA